MRMRGAGFLVLSFAFGHLSLNAADAFTRPGPPGHPLPEGEGRNSINAFAPPQTNDTAWQSAMMQRLDESIARLHAEASQRQTTSAEISASLPELHEATPSLASAKTSTAASIARLLREQGLPSGLTSVVVVESAFDPLALSPKGARGLWQLMPATARRYGLKVEPQTDERVDPVKSTYAASAYLKDLFVQFQDWPLALAAYNAGEDRVARAIAKTGASDFWTLRRRAALPQETLQYVPAVLQKLEAPLHAPTAEYSVSRETSAPSELAVGRIAYATAAVEGN